jgi:hypothetical protein
MRACFVGLIVGMLGLSGCGGSSKPTTHAARALRATRPVVNDTPYAPCLRLWNLSPAADSPRGLYSLAAMGRQRTTQVEVGFAYSGPAPSQCQVTVLRGGGYTEWIEVHAPGSHYKQGSYGPNTPPGFVANAHLEADGSVALGRR